MPRQVSVGALSFLYTNSGLRRISWHGTELIRAIGWPIRDENWGTYPPHILSETVNTKAGFEAQLSFSVGQGRLVCDLRIAANHDGALDVDLTMTPKDGPFPTNRAGFTVLHPIKGLAGAPLMVRHAHGMRETTAFPKHIQPDQPVKDIAALTYSLDGQAVEIEFDGEVFEMEDQRNWSDASYKTYCVPLVHPFTYDIDEPISQTIRIQCSGVSAPSQSDIARPAPPTAPTLGIALTTSDQKAPDVGLALDSGWDATGLDSLDPAHIALRTAPQADDLPRLCACARAARAVDLEIVLPDDTDVADGLKNVREALAAEGIAPRRVIALRQSYLASHQPVGPWPSGPTPNDMLPLVRATFPDAAVGGGMLTNFTELNRYRPEPEACDFITHGATPLVHAGDDMSVLETLEALPQIFASVEAIAPGKPYRLGLVSIGMRSNPYGSDIAANPAQVRRTMARIDPRHRGLFGAAFAVGVLAATQGSAVEAVCLAAPTGPFGLWYAPADYPQAGYDGAGRAVYPLFHVVREACAMSGLERLAIGGLPKDVMGYGTTQDGASRIILANLSDQEQTVPLGGQARITRLDTDTFDAATKREDWLDTAPAARASSVVLPPFAVAFVRNLTSQI